MTYEGRLDAIAEEKNEQKQIEKHFEDLNRERLEEQLSDALTRLEDTLSENEQLKAQIEKMKMCCENCDFNCQEKSECLANNYKFWKLKE